MDVYQFLTEMEETLQGQTPKSAEDLRCIETSIHFMMMERCNQVVPFELVKNEKGTISLRLTKVSNGKEAPKA